MTLTISRILLTILLLIIGYFVWTKNVNLITWSKSKINEMLPINETNDDGYSLDFSFKNLSFNYYQNILDRQDPIKPKIVIALYNVVIVNKNNFSSTIKDIKASIHFKDGTKKETNSIQNIKTYQLNSGSPAILIVTVNNNHEINSKMVVVGWENLYPKINKRKVLLPGEVITGSLLIKMECSPKELRNIEYLKLTISDFLNNVSIQKVKIESKNYIGLDKNLIIFETPFYQDEDSRIIIDKPKR